MQEAIEIIRNYEFDLQLATRGRARLHQAYVAFLDDLSEAHKRLIQRYRDANRKTRTTPPPGFFGRSIERPLFLQPSPLPVLPEVEQDSRQDVVATIGLYIRQLNEKFERTLPEYQTVRELTSVTPVQRASA
jgi:hypothetical protein